MQSKKSAAMQFLVLVGVLLAVGLFLAFGLWFTIIVASILLALSPYLIAAAIFYAMYHWYKSERE